jgi:hypothetical protein
MQLMGARWARVAAAVALVGLPAAAAADGTLSMRGAYYKERSTRVVQPMLDASLATSDDGRLDLHTLVDSITSASPAAGAAGGTAFTERRYELGATYRHELEAGRVAVGGRISEESDYSSLFGHARVELDVAQRSAVLGLGVAQGRDRVSNAGAQGMVTESIGGVLHTTMLSASLRQILDERLVAQLGYDFIYLTGFQENPYRLVPAGGQLELERVPRVRHRHAVVGSLRRFVPRTGTTVAGSYRFYLDDWGVSGHTPEVRAIQDLRAGLDVALRYRYHSQGAADFYQPVYDSADPAASPFLTADVKLSEMSTHTLGGKLGVGLGLLGMGPTLAAGRLDLVVEYVWQSTYVGNAIVAQLGVTVPLSY